jgi:hypothetical protein
MFITKKLQNYQTPLLFMDGSLVVVSLTADALVADLGAVPLRGALNDFTDCALFAALALLQYILISITTIFKFKCTSSLLFLLIRRRCRNYHSFLSQ